GLFVVGAVALAWTPAVAADFAVSAPTFTAYVVNGTNNPTLNLVRGQTYTFDVNSPGHPFFIKTAQVTGSGSTFDTGVTNNGATAGTVTFAVPTSAPATLFYQCGVHAAMTGTLAITTATPPVSAGDGLTRTLLGLLLAGLGLVVIGRTRRGLTRRRLTA
ncbi:MAG TPA: hypothetical protein VK989_12755, partial [Polyangia bacterium]|nr:hypothetical protein [Polyangia bacterium]